MVTGYCRGHKIIFINNDWKWADTMQSIDNERPCVRCNKPPTPEGYDACIGFVPGKTSMCCGHGVTKPIE